MTRRGLSIVELLIGLIIGALVLSVVMRTFDAGYNTLTHVTSQNTAYSRARFAIDTLADHLRNAQRNTNNSGILNSVLASGTDTSVSYYVDSAGTTVSYVLNNGNLERTSGGTTSVVCTGLTSLSLQYYVSNTYNGNVTATAAATPTNYELLLTSVIKITATVSTDGHSASYATTVKLRNSPKKARLSGG